MEAPTKSARPAPNTFSAFDPFLRQYGTMSRVLEAARHFSFAVEDFSRPSSDGPAFDEVIVIDETALLLAFVAVGVEVREQESSAAWFVEWLEQRGVDLSQLLEQHADRAGRTQRAIADMPVAAGGTVETEILPAAVDLAKRTIGRNHADARHLLWVLAQAATDDSGPFKDIFGGDGLAAFNQHMLTRLETSHEEKEDLAAWRSLVAEPLPVETVGTLSDAPALVDALGRQAFAEVLASRVKQVSQTLRSGKLGSDAAFILHIDGPWGSGKSSILNFLKTDLEKSDPAWLVVEFNAWRNQQRVPAWWPIISHVGAAASALSWFHYPRARWVWTAWNMRMRWVPLMLTAVLTVAFIYFAWRAVAGDKATDFLGVMKDMVAGALALATLAGLAWTTSRSIFFGSKTAAEAYVQSTAEPFRPIIDLFEHLVSAIGRPVAVFIDDIDRCDCTYVIDLLEGIQTLLRSAPVVYVVAGDRKWICSSFEKRYVDFGGQIGVPGRPLGYLFLDKVFQLSTAIPRLSTVRQAAFWRRLLESGEQGAHTSPDAIKQLEADAERELKGKTSHEDIQRQINSTEEGTLERETIRAAAAKQITSPEAIRAAEHRLQPLAGLLEPNPRSMKRLVNSYGLNHARAFLEGREVEVEALARWTIVELRWPLLADYLATNWTDIAAHTLSIAQFPEPIQALLADTDVREVFGRDGEAGRLTISSLGPILE